MANVVIVGVQWGDEGKGKIVDLLSRENEYIVRFQGGNNAGHTVIANGKKHVLHLVPSGILHEGKVCLIGNGVVLDPFRFVEEVKGLEEQGVDVSPRSLRVSVRTHLIMPYHKRLDAARESAAGERKIGTTGSGIGPCYEDKAGRIGVRAGDLRDPDLVKAKIAFALREKNVLLSCYGLEPMSVETVFDEIMSTAPRIVPHLSDVAADLQAAMQAGKNILFEGAQGTHLDIDHGTYPFVTSSSTLAGNAALGSGVAPTKLDRVIGILKAYTTRVGAGPFPTELHDSIGETLQRRGGEFGATTGRPRRCGWQDGVLLRQSARLNGLTEIALTKLDVLSGFSELKICVAYEHNGQQVTLPPQGEGDLGRVTPVYETCPGWNENLEGCTSFADLPEAARAYVRRLEEIAEVPVRLVSVGADRDQTFAR